MSDITFDGDAMADPADAQPYEYAPEGTEQLDQDPISQPQYSLDNRGVNDGLDEGYSPPEKPSPLMRHGMTANEQLEGETLDERLAEEEPEVWEQPYSEDVVDDGEVGGVRAGRLVDPNQGIGEDVDSELIGVDVGIDGAAASAEEAAMHVVPDDE